MKQNSPPTLVSYVVHVETGNNPSVVVPQEVTVDFVASNELTLEMYDVETLFEVKVVRDVPGTVE